MKWPVNQDYQDVLLLINTRSCGETAQRISTSHELLLLLPFCLCFHDVAATFFVIVAVIILCWDDEKRCYTTPTSLQIEPFGRPGLNPTYANAGAILANIFEKNVKDSIHSVFGRQSTYSKPPKMMFFTGRLKATRWKVILFLVPLASPAGPLFVASLPEQHSTASQALQAERPCHPQAPVASPAEAPHRQAPLPEEPLPSQAQA